MADLNWDTLAERRHKHRLILFFKMKDGISPEYLTHLIPQPQAQPAYVIAQMFQLSLVTLNPMLLHSCPLLFTSGIHFLKISETPLHSANLNPKLTQNQRNHSCTMLEVDNIKLITLVSD